MDLENFILDQKMKIWNDKQKLRLKRQSLEHSFPSSLKHSPNEPASADHENVENIDPLQNSLLPVDKNDIYQTKHVPFVCLSDSDKSVDIDYNGASGNCLQEVNKEVKRAENGVQRRTLGCTKELEVEKMVRFGEYSPNNPQISSGKPLLGLGAYEERHQQLVDKKKKELKDNLSQPIEAQKPKETPETGLWFTDEARSVQAVQAQPPAPRVIYIQREDPNPPPRPPPVVEIVRRRDRATSPPIVYKEKYIQTSTQVDNAVNTVPIVQQQQQPPVQIIVLKDESVARKSFSAPQDHVSQVPPVPIVKYSSASCRDQLEAELKRTGSAYQPSFFEDQANRREAGPRPRNSFNYHISQTTDQLPDPKPRKEVYQKDLLRQIEERKRVEAEKKRQEAQEEELFMKRVVEQQEKMQREFEEEQENKKWKEEERRRKTEEFHRRQEQIKKESERLRREEIRKRVADKRRKSFSIEEDDTDMKQPEEENFTIQEVRGNSPPVPSHRAKAVYRSSSRLPPAGSTPMDMLESKWQVPIDELAPSGGAILSERKVLTQLGEVRRHLQDQQVQMEDALQRRQGPHSQETKASSRRNEEEEAAKYTGFQPVYRRHPKIVITGLMDG